MSIESLIMAMAATAILLIPGIVIAIEHKRISHWIILPNIVLTPLIVWCIMGISTFTYQPKKIELLEVKDRLADDGISTSQFITHNGEAVNLNKNLGVVVPKNKKIRATTYHQWNVGLKFKVPSKYEIVNGETKKTTKH